jgi:hypothetical protein
MVTPVARRSDVPAMREAHKISERRACMILGVDRSVVRYRSCRSDDAALRARLRGLAGERRRFGYRRLGLLLAREGVQLNHKRLRWIYTEERLQVRRSCCPTGWTSAGLWISCRILCRTVGGCRAVGDRTARKSTPCRRCLARHDGRVDFLNRRNDAGQCPR